MFGMICFPRIKLSICLVPSVGSVCLLFLVYSVVSIRNHWNVRSFKFDILGFKRKKLSVCLVQNFSSWPDVYFEKKWFLYPKGIDFILPKELFKSTLIKFRVSLFKGNLRRHKISQKIRVDFHTIIVAWSKYHYIRDSGYQSGQGVIKMKPNLA